MEHTILVAEDEEGIREAISIYLQNQGYSVLQAANGQEGLDLVHSNSVHLAIVDLMMPVMDGITMIRKLREEFDFPIIILSAKGQEIDKINGLTIGADDYLTKPFASMELVARVRALLRRYEQILDLKKVPEPKKESLYRVGGLELNPISREVKVDGKPIHLTPKEFQILQLLIRHPNQVFKAEQIYESIWKEDALSTETITVHIRKLREKIETDPKKPRYLQVVWGQGYKLSNGDER